MTTPTPDGESPAPPQLDPSRYYTPAEAARLSGLPEPTIRRWLAEGLPHLPTGRRGRGEGVRIKGAWLAEWAEARKVRARPTPTPEVEAPAVTKGGGKGKPRPGGPAKGADGRIVLR